MTNDQDFISSLESPGAAGGDPLAIARQTIAGLGVRLSGDPDKEAFKSDVIFALRVLKEEARGEYEQAIKDIAASGVRVRAIESEVAGDGKTKLRAVSAGDDGRKLACDYLPNAPIRDLVIPAGYRLMPDQTLAAGLMGDDVIAHGALLITGRTRDIDGESEGVRVSWSRGNGWRHKIIDRGVVADARKIISLADSGFPVTSSDSKSQVEYFAALEAENYAALPVAQTTGHLGFQGPNREFGFLAGGELLRPDGQSVKAEIKADSMDWKSGGVTFRGAGAGDEQIVSGYHRSGTLAEWITEIEKTKPFPRVLATIYAAFVPPMLSILDCPNFIIDLSAATSKGKTTTQRAAASVWGCPDERKPGSALQTWDATKVYIERASAVLGDLPLILDDTKRAKDQRQIAETLYAVASGRGRGRGTVGGIATTKTWHTVLISSGEQPVTSFTTDGGTRMRVLEIDGAPFGKVDTEAGKIVESLNLSLRASYGHAGPEFVRWLLQNRDSWPEWQKEYRNRAQAYIQSATGEKAGRLAAYAAAIAQTASLVHSALDLPWTFEDPLKTLWAEISSEADDAVGAKRAMRYVMSWASGNESRFIGREMDTRIAPSGGWLGRWDRGDDYEFIAFYPHEIENILTSQKYHADSILTEWRERGWLDIKDTSRKRFTKLTRVRGENNPIQMLVVKRAAIDEIEE